VALKSDGGWLVKPVVVHNEVVCHISPHFSDTCLKRPTLDAVWFSLPYMEENLRFVTDFSEESETRIWVQMVSILFSTKLFGRKSKGNRRLCSNYLQRYSSMVTRSN